MDDETRIGEESRCNDVKGRTHAMQGLQKENWNEVFTKSPSKLVEKTNRRHKIDLRI